jgi:hypothetical protein
VKPRAGVALLELVVAAVLSAVVMGLAVLLLQAQSRVARDLTLRSERNDAHRSAFATLSAELRSSTSHDVTAVARDSISARIFRGLAIVCGFHAGETFVRYRGLRLPDPAKDSALQTGLENVVALGSVRANSSACPHVPGEQVLALHWHAPPRVGAGWLIFERGSYHINANALRYRQGSGPRQPVTAGIFDDTASGFVAVADSVLRAIDINLADHQPPGRTRIRVRLLNGL